jgi:cyanophycin synthetase
MNGGLASISRRRSLAAFRLDLLRELGVRHAIRRTVANLRHRRVLAARRNRVPEEMWREAARTLGAEVVELAPTLLEFRLGPAITRVRGQTTPFADPVSEAVASDKFLAYRILSEGGLPVPAHELVGIRDLSAAAGFLHRVGGPCIVKPARGRGGSGVTGEVRTVAQLRRALVSAGRFHHQALLEQQCAGDSYRLLVLDGEVLDVIRRPLPQVVGDGRSTIEQLMFRQYEERIRVDGPGGLKPFPADLDCLFTITQAGYSVRSVLAPGEAVTIKTATNYNGPRDSVSIPAPYPETFISLARRAAAVLGVRLGGVDLVASADDQAVVLEVNAIPGLTHHYNVSDPERAQRIAIPLLESLLRVESAAAEP